MVENNITNKDNASTAQVYRTLTGTLKQCDRYLLASSNFFQVENNAGASSQSDVSAIGII